MFLSMMRDAVVARCKRLSIHPMSMRRVLLLIACLFASSLYAQAGTIAEQYLLSALNQERLNHHLAPVRPDAALRRAALLHAQQMADHGTISHQFAGEPTLSARGSNAGALFDLITENVAEGPTAVILHDAWMHSAGHRANILDAAVDTVGIAVIARNGQLYAVQDFERSVQRLSLEQQEAAVGILLDTAGLEVVPGTAARETCGLNTGYAGEEQPAFIVRYTTSDLTKLPSQLRERLASHNERLAAVGACAPGTNNSFTSYSLAILLYR
jgi:hypothetical protein